MAHSNKYYAVMLVDDNEIDNLINQKMIEASAICEHIFVHSGAKSAIEFLKNIEILLKVNTSMYLPELIFLDIDMPLMDGFQFLEEFDRLSDGIKSHCKVIMLTSSMNPMDMSKAKKNNYVYKYLNKPLTQESLKKLLKE
jgi:CheY-like chemotaxis protein